MNSQVASRIGTETQAGASRPAPHLSIVIPAYNESVILPVTLACLETYFAAQPFSTEVIVVDDGSTDATPSVLQRFSTRSFALRVLRNPANEGKGSSVRRGILASRGKYVLFTDADLPARPEDIASLLEPLYHGKNVAIASRISLRGSSDTSPLRRVVSKMYRRSVHAILGLPVRDTQFGFKAFVREPILPVFEDLRQLGYSFDAEILFVAWQFGLSIQEVGIPMIERRAATRHAILLWGPHMLLDLFRIRFRAARGSRAVLARVAPFLLGVSRDLHPRPGAGPSRLS